MSVLDIDLETNIMDFSKHDRNGRIYDPDCAKIPDEYSIPEPRIPPSFMN